MKPIVKYLILVVLVAFLAGCAQIGSSLTGEPKDTYAPQIDSSGTYPLSGQTNFTGSEIQIKFKEYIKLNNPNDNIIITPQLTTKPEVKAKNKKLTIIFQEKLEENTTYTVTFNHAIADITEKNDSVFQYVFSTGDYIDSLTLSGDVKNAFTNKAEEGFLVALYGVDTESSYDSLPYNESPIYITQTKKNGTFDFNYLKGGEYYIFAFQDKNKNLRLEPGEKLAMAEQETVVIGLENEAVYLAAFEMKNSAVDLKNTNFEYPGKVTFVLSNPPDIFTVNTELELVKEELEKKDSLIFWLAEPPIAKMQFRVQVNDDFDTLKPLYKGIPENEDVQQLTVTNNVASGKLLPNEPLNFVFSSPIGKVDSAGVHFFDADSTVVVVPPGRIENVRTLVFETQNTTASRVVIDSGAVTSFYNHVNPQIEIKTFTNRAADYYGTLTINTDSVFQIPVILQLLDEKQNVVAEQPYQKQVVFTELEPGNYQLRLILDENNDGEWTTGALINRRLPEKIIYNTELINVKSKWEKEVDWFLKINQTDS